MPKEKIADALPLKRYGQIINQLGLAEDIITLLSANISVNRIAQLLNEKLKEEGSTHIITRQQISAWLSDRPAEIQKGIKEAQYTALLNEVWLWETHGIQVREEVNRELEKLIPDADSVGELTMQERNALANIIMKKLQVQESGERFMGIGTSTGKRYKDININVNVDLIDRMRELVAKKKKKLDEEDILDIECVESEAEGASEAEEVNDNQD